MWQKEVRVWNNELRVVVTKLRETVGEKAVADRRERLRNMGVFQSIIFIGMDLQDALDVLFLFHLPIVMIV